MPQKPPDILASIGPQQPPMTDEQAAAHVYAMSCDVTWEPQRSPYHDRLDDKQWRRFERALNRYYDADYQTALPWFESLVRDLPWFAPAYTYLCSIYDIFDRTDEARQLARQSYERFPDYIFAIATYVQICVSQGDLAQAYRVVGHNWSVMQLQPDRQTFHVTEVRAYQTAMMELLLADGRIQDAAPHADMLIEIADDEEQADQIDQRMMLATAQAMTSRLTSGEFEPWGEGPDDPAQLARRIDDPARRERLHGIAGLCDTVCETHLNDAYRASARRMAADVCGHRDLQPARGKAQGWTAGVLYLLGQLNDLTSRDAQPHLRTEDLAEACGVSTATMYNRAREIREALGIQITRQWLPTRAR
jgi:tetratricopeptide (TPR) repeat protein